MICEGRFTGPLLYTLERGVWKTTLVDKRVELKTFPTLPISCTLPIASNIRSGGGEWLKRSIRYTQGEMGTDSGGGGRWGFWGG
jgi:hypothetical protein